MSIGREGRNLYSSFSLVLVVENQKRIHAHYLSQVDVAESGSNNKKKQINSWNGRTERSDDYATLKVNISNPDIVTSKRGPKKTLVL